MIRQSMSFALAALSLAAFSTPALSQKSVDTLRVAQNEAFKALSPFYFPAREASFAYRQVYATLVDFNERKGEFVGDLAKSWTRPDQRTIEFDLRDDIKFHSGNGFSADDVVYTINWLRDPKVKLPFKDRYTWIENVEKLGPYKVRTTSRGVNATDLMLLAFRIYIYDKKLHEPLTDKSEYGRKTPVGTGPYRVAGIDAQQRMTLNRFDGSHKNPHHRAPIKTILLDPIPDEQTQVAQLITGGVDVVRNISTSNAKGLEANPSVVVRNVASGTIGYFFLDAVNRTGKKELSDPRVRRAIFMAVDREAIRKEIMPGASASQLLQAFCVPYLYGCSYSTQPPPYDPAGAKKLLVEAGYPNGFDLEITSHQDVTDVTTAIAGYLRTIGIRATVKPVTTLVMRKSLADNQVHALSSVYPAGNMPDVDATFNITFDKGPRDHFHDQIIYKAMDEGRLTHDIKAREKIYRVAFDRINEQHYILPMATLPTVLAYNKSIKFLPGLLSDTDVTVSDFEWN